MSTTKCGHTTPCGCADVALTTPAPCNPVGCPDPYPCSEVINAECVIYTGDDILCDQTSVVSQGMNTAEAMVAIVDYFCNSTGSISENITCGDDTVVTAGSTFADAFEQVVDYFCQNSGGSVSIVEGDITTNVTSNVVGNTTTYTVSIEDTGWVDLEGFAYYQGGMSTQKPQARRIGKQIHFRGDLIVPITDGLNVIPVTAVDTYRTVMIKTPFAATGGVYFDSDDIMYFNSTGSAGGVVIPTSVLPIGTNLDGNYKLTRELASRQLRVFDTAAPPNLEGTTLLHAPVEISITANKQLKLTALEVFEKNAADQTSFVGSSSLRNITSSFTFRSFMLNFKSFLFGGDGLNSMGGAPPNGGGLAIGIQYYIENYQAGDDFTNVGALTNANYVTFTATGGTPTDWTNGSRLVAIPDTIQNYDFFYPNLGANESSQWPILTGSGISLDGADPYDLGGYKISLDGLMAYIQ